ncbi:hypothetical protein PoB_007181100 [Plakobranchus ocellatus]|uniref:Uncharacterized protein n=1 Tax=Plakobranchus ocellatus TaxID=259542 RepID=A0AAV4DMB4_9GAST|nr:hypothetical protein PoB_007181100 [Plakobranchus ocellatus]
MPKRIQEEQKTIDAGEDEKIISKETSKRIDVPYLPPSTNTHTHFPYLFQTVKLQVLHDCGLVGRVLGYHVEATKFHFKFGPKIISSALCPSSPDPAAQYLNTGPKQRQDQEQKQTLQPVNAKDNDDDDDDDDDDDVYFDGDSHDYDDDDANDDYDDDDVDADGDKDNGSILMILNQVIHLTSTAMKTQMPQGSDHIFHMYCAHVKVFCPQHLAARRGKKRYDVINMKRDIIKNTYKQGT